jgi:NTE family protein
MKLGLALSGGGVRGIVHIGVLQALTEAGIPIHAVSGSSAGAIVGSLFAAGYSPKDIYHLARERSLIRIFNLKIPNKGFVRHTFLRRQLEKHLPGNSFDDLVLPFYVTVANINSGHAETFHEGPLIDLVVASCSVPILFEPVIIAGTTYVDGGLMKNLPVSPLRSTCDIVIGVNLVPQVALGTSELKSVFSIGTRCFDLVALNNIKPELAQCDFVIEPQEISKFGRLLVSNVEQMYQIGYREGHRYIDEILLKVREQESVSAD